MQVTVSTFPATRVRVQFPSVPAANRFSEFVQQREDVWEHSVDRIYVVYICKDKSAAKEVHDSFERKMLEDAEKAAQTSSKETKTAQDSPKKDSESPQSQSSKEKTEKNAQDSDQVFTKKSEEKSGCKGCGKNKEEK